jgi:hypothetical protein
LETLEAFYSATLDALQEAKNDVSSFPLCFGGVLIKGAEVVREM